MSVAVAPAALAALVGATQPAEEPKGTLESKPATEGKTDLEGLDEFGKAKEPPKEEEEESTDATELQISAGGLFSTGNARSLAVTGSGRFRLRRSIHQFGTDVAGNYAQAAFEEDADAEPTVSNIQGRVRYDIFFHERWSAFVMATARHDPFQALDLRLNIDPGVAFYALTKKTHRLWFEAGYDYQYDLRTEDAIIAKDDNDEPILDEMGNTIQIIDKVRHNHAVRLFAGYSNHLSEYVTFDTGLEFLQSVLVLQRWRINWDMGLTASLGKRLAFATTFTMRVDNDPVPGIKKIDTITAVNLVVTIL